MRRYAHSLATISNISWSFLPSEADEVSCRLSEKSGIIACTNCIRAIPIVTSSLKLFQKTRGNNPQKHQTGEQNFSKALCSPASRSLLYLQYTRFFCR